MTIDINAKIDEFITRVEVAAIGPLMDIVLTIHLIDATTNSLIQPVRRSVMPDTTIAGQ